MVVVHIPTKMNFIKISGECDNDEMILENEYGVRNAVSKEMFKRFFTTPQGLVLYENQKNIQKEKQIENKIKREAAKQRKEQRDIESNSRLVVDQDLSDRVAEYVCEYHRNVGDYGCFDPEDEIRRIATRQEIERRRRLHAKGE